MGMEYDLKTRTIRMNSQEIQMLMDQIAAIRQDVAGAREEVAKVRDELKQVREDLASVRVDVAGLMPSKDQVNEEIFPRLRALEDAHNRGKGVLIAVGVVASAVTAGALGVLTKVYNLLGK